jgi:hypothetical protein
VRRALPDRAFVPLDMSHRFFRAHFKPHDLQGMAEHIPGGDIT